VTEGEDKPLKYPTVFNTADVVVVTKVDLAAAVEFDARALDRNLQAVRPGIEALAVSAKSGDEMGAWLDLLAAGRAGCWRKKATARRIAGSMLRWSPGTVAASTSRPRSGIAAGASGSGRRQSIAFG
jgi:G3E family GTPase